MDDSPLILVIDDDLALQRLTIQLLTRAGCRTCQADGGQSGLQRVRDSFLNTVR